MRRATVTKGCRQRCVYPTNRDLIPALEDWLALRIAKRWRMTDKPKKFCRENPAPYDAPHWSVATAFKGRRPKKSKNALH